MAPWKPSVVKAAAFLLITITQSGSAAKLRREEPTDGGRGNDNVLSGQSPGSNLQTPSSRNFQTYGHIGLQQTPDFSKNQKPELGAIKAQNLQQNRTMPFFSGPQTSSNFGLQGGGKGMPGGSQNYQTSLSSPKLQNPNIQSPGSNRQTRTARNFQAYGLSGNPLMPDWSKTLELEFGDIRAQGLPERRMPLFPGPQSSFNSGGYRCPANYMLDDQGRCVPANCPPGMVYNPYTQQCQQQCPPGTIQNAATGLCEATGPVCPACPTQTVCPPGTTKNINTGLCELTCSSCYQCPPGAIKNPISGQCDSIQPLVCPPGTQLNPLTNQCGPVSQNCPLGTQFNPLTNQCESVSQNCPPGTQFNPLTNQCGSVSQNCPPGTQFNPLTNQCGSVSQNCPPGTQFNPLTNQCGLVSQNCPPGTQFNPLTNQCGSISQNCPPGTQFNPLTNQCGSVSQNCPPGTQFNPLTNQCGSVFQNCPPGAQFNPLTNQCGSVFQNCPPGTQLNPYTNRCQSVSQNCPRGTQFNPMTNQCEPQVNRNCPPGTQFNPQSGQCQQQDNCPFETRLNRFGQCVPICDICSSPEVVQRINICSTSRNISTCLRRHGLARDHIAQIFNSGVINDLQSSSAGSQQDNQKEHFKLSEQKKRPRGENKAR